MTAIIGLVNPKNPSNVGSVLRAAGCYGVEAIFYTGKRYQLAMQHEKGHGKRKHTDTNNASASIKLQAVEDLTSCVDSTTKIVCVELVEGATPLPAFVHPDDALYIFGPEDGSVPQALVDVADAVVYVPTIGCMNLAATTNVLLYDRLAKSNGALGSEAMIKSSRDNNNRLKVKS